MPPDDESPISLANQWSARMTDLTYTIVQHDGGWAYKAAGAISETFANHDEAREAARRAAAEQRQPGETVVIAWEDDKGKWHEETALGGDRPNTDVTG